MCDNEIGGDIEFNRRCAERRNISSDQCCKHTLKTKWESTQKTVNATIVLLTWPFEELIVITGERDLSLKL